MADYYVREEDGTSRYILEDASGDYLLETSPATISPSFIASATVVNDPTVSAAGFVAPFIASATVVNSSRFAMRRPSLPSASPRHSLRA